MALKKRPSSSSRSASPTPQKKINLISIPGVQVSDLLKYEELFPDIRFHLTFIVLFLVIIGQIRVDLSTAKPSIIQGISSVNFYVRNFLSKHPSLTYVTSAVALTRSMIDFVNDTTPDRILEAHKDLSSNLTGPVNTKGGLAANLNTPAKLRTYRRGIMAQVTGQLQAEPIHNPRRLVLDIEKITSSEFLERLPFKTDDIQLDLVLSQANEILREDGDVRIFTDIPCVKEGSVPLEEKLEISRIKPSLPDALGAPDLDSLPVWRRGAYIQLRNLTEGS